MGESRQPFDTIVSTKKNFIFYFEGGGGAVLNHPLGCAPERHVQLTGRRAIGEAEG
jgi:hypothetical protein